MKKIGRARMALRRMIRIDPSARLIDSKTMKVCTMCLGELSGGTTWTVEMDAIEADWLTRNDTKHQDSIA